MQPETLKEHVETIGGSLSYLQLPATRTVALSALDALAVEVERLTAELEGLKSKLGGDKVASESAVVWSEPRQDSPGGVVYREGFGTGTGGIGSTAVRNPGDSRAVRSGDEPRELRCQIFEVEHEVWIAPSDIWNAVCRDGDRGKADKWSFLCPVCFMRMGSAMGLAPTGWLVTPEPGGVIRYASWLKIQPPSSTTSEPGSLPEPSPPASPLEGHETGPDKQTGDDIRRPSGGEPC